MNGGWRRGKEEREKKAFERRKEEKRGSHIGLHTVQIRFTCWRSQHSMLTSCCSGVRVKKKGFLFFIDNFYLVFKLHLQFLHFASVRSRV